MIRMMYCATWVQVTALMPPSIEHTRMPSEADEARRPRSDDIEEALR